jgi:hypothetical protein
VLIRSPTPDDNDMVTSSEDNAVLGGRHSVPTSDSSTQTSKKVLYTCLIVFNRSFGSSDV